MESGGGISSMPWDASPATFRRRSGPSTAFAVISVARKAAVSGPVEYNTRRLRLGKAAAPSRYHAHKSCRETPTRTSAGAKKRLNKASTGHVWISEVTPVLPSRSRDKPQMRRFAIVLVAALSLAACSTSIPRHPAVYVPPATPTDAPQADPTA